MNVAALVLVASRAELVLTEFEKRASGDLPLILTHHEFYASTDLQRLSPPTEIAVERSCFDAGLSCHKSKQQTSLQQRSIIKHDF